MAFEFKYDVVKDAPTIAEFLRSKAELNFIKGPVGSGKSVGCCIKVFLIALNQAPGIDGVRRTRFTVVRNTRDQLNDTTLKTWQEWFPDGDLGHYKISDRTYVFSFTPPDKIPVYSEVMFRALDDPKDVAKVLSLEVTAAWLNECREIPKEIVEHLAGRCGRYPSDKIKPPEIPAENWPTYHGLFGDTNAPEQDSFWYNVFEHLPTDDAALYPEETILECKTFSQPPGDWSQGKPENFDHLIKGYYERKGRSDEWYRTMVLVKYGRSISGKPVYEKTFKSDRHVSAQPLKIFSYLPVVIGIDTGRKPAAVFQQMTLNNRIYTQHEARELDMGAKSFIAQRIRPIIKNFYPNHALIFILDPAGSRQNDTDDNSWFKELKAQFKGHIVKFAVTNDLTPRINATDEVLRSWPDGEPMNLIDPSCIWVIQGLRGKYRYERVRGKDDKYADVPTKNAWSHPVEAKQYADLFMTGKFFRNEDYVRSIHNPATGQTSYKPVPYTGY